MSTGQTVWQRSQRIQVSRSTCKRKELAGLNGDQSAPSGQIQRQKGRRVALIQANTIPRMPSLIQ
jgi:hypothetical protein